MEQKRSIKHILPAFKVNMGGIILDQGLPHQMVDHIDPFLLLHHLEHTYDKGMRQQEVGVPPHPHRGFAPVTFVFKGGVHHRDSLNTSSVVYGGGTQWMHAGRGIVHSERPPKEIAENGDTWELIQFWVNVPANQKMTTPEYLPLTYEDTPTYHTPDHKVSVGVVAGTFMNLNGGIVPKTPILALRLEMKAGGLIQIPIPETYNAFVYQLDGQLVVNDSQRTKAKDLIWLNNDGTSLTLDAKEETRAILLAGEPINEAIEAHGPFVMNNRTEILEAMRDYQMGKMGVLIEEFD